MTKLPRASGRQLVKSFHKIGYEFDRQHGSHIVLRQPNPPHRRLTIPDHKEIATGTLRSILRESGISIQQLLELL